jgi:hypothetical protein
MNVNHLDARALTQPGGMYAGINDAVLQTVAAYLQSQDRERQGQRDLVRDERANRQAQYRQALQDAASLGVAPSAENAGWLAPQDQAGIHAALAERMRKITQTDEDRKRAAGLAALNEKRQRLELAAAGAMPEPGETDLLGERWPDPSEAAAYEHGTELRKLKLAQLRKALEETAKPGGTPAAMAEWAFGRDGDNSPILFNRRTGETKLVPGAPAKPVTAPTPVAAAPSNDGPGVLSRQVQRIGDYWSAPTLTPRWAEPNRQNAPSVPAPAALPQPTLPMRPASTNTLAPQPAMRGPNLDQIRALPAEQRRAYLRDLAQRDPAAFQAIRHQMTGQ